MAADKECVVVTTTAKSLIGQLAPGQHACLLTCCYCCLRQTGFINLFVENGDAVEQERIFFLEEFSDYCLVKPSAAS